MSDLRERLRCRALLDRVMPAEDAAALIRDGMSVATSGFTPAGYPKAVPLALAERVRRTAEHLAINLFTGASVGPELDDSLVLAGVVRKRLPYQTSRAMRDAINRGNVLYVDDHLGQVAQRTRHGFYGRIDLALIEAVAVTEDGHIIPSTSVGNSPTWVRLAERVIVEINTSQPAELAGMHDIYLPADPPFAEPIPLTSPGQRIGTEYIPCGPEKIAGIVVTDLMDSARSLEPVDDCARAIAGHLVEFLEREVDLGRLPPNLLPLQSGVGSMANAVLAGLLDSGFTGMTFYSEVIQDSALDLIDSGQFTVASGTSLTLSPARLEAAYASIHRYRDRIILRPQEISNSPEVIRRMGVIAMNTAIECDIYGNVNSTHILGSHMVNGIGGSGDFSRNAYLTIFMARSTARKGAVSAVVPMCSHIDHTEHEVHVIVTEQGLADLRGLSPRERARTIIDNCAHPDYRPMLRDYLADAARRGGHTPHDVRDALSWHVRLLDTGDMRRS